MPRSGLAVLGAVVLSFAIGQGPAPSAAQAREDEAPEEEARTDEAEGIRIAAMAVCEDVQERVPVGESETFSREVGHLYCFTAIQGADPPTEIFHRWYVGDRLINEIPIDVKGERWRCWSRKTILPRWKGACRVDVVTEEGDVLGTREFTLE
jgi:hypothetical protein